MSDGCDDGSGHGATDSRAELIITGGKVATLDREEKIAEAVAVRGGKIIAVGTNAEVEAMTRPGARRIDAGGRLVGPGLIDAHAHMDREGLKERLPSLAGCRSIDDVLQRIEALVRETPRGEWIVTMPIGEPPFYEGVPGNLRDKRWPTRHDLDKVAPDHPVYIRPIWGHWRNTLPLVSVANTRALELAGITRATMPPSPSIQIDKELDSGEPSGIIYEFVFKPLAEKTLMSCIPRFSIDDRIAGLKRSMEVYNSVGTTSVVEGHGIAGEVFAAYQACHQEAGEFLPVRSHLMFSPSWSDPSPSAVRELLVDWGRWLARRGLGDEFLRMAGLYAENDRSPENDLRALCGPYTGWAGFNFDAALPSEVMFELLLEAARLGIRVGSFDPGILEVYERVHRQVAIDDQRWMIEHVGVFNRDEVKRIADLGLGIQYYTGRYIGLDGDKLRGRLGEARVDEIVPMRWMIEAGVHAALATDNVPPTMFVPIHHAVARVPDNGTPRLGEAQALTRLEALAAASREGAWLSFDEDFKGTIEPGKAADIVILSDDLLTCDEDRIPGITADVTITGGRIVWEKETGVEV